MTSASFLEASFLALHSDCYFAIPNFSLALEHMRGAKDGQRVVLTYDEYKGKVLWRGNSKHVVTSIERDTNFIKTNPYKDKAPQAEEKKD